MTARVHPASEEEKATFIAFTQANPRLTEALPLVLPSGATVTSYALECASCGNNIDPRYTWLNRARHTFGSSVVEIWDARALCVGCRTTTSSYIRYRSDGSFDTLIGHEGRRGQLSDEKKPTPLTSRITNLLQRWFGR